ncbi:hypothetical protein A2304_05080 [Candidatus Uhrbacteria bacterium RIFOXYB2_FULL_57_15]|uniref:Uncharacterized protein n=1 Tax=Candidatus Uhrbacteria bacterium RIFOXYB2_FULL_57_15 TaxID=1802422 RepID=A0A1F7W876_9BACT|nr:MAG: hypothetical protein A2304_05080 [Candidatus Uhrbacteria bacterium RIFOXYB2_FULL_57_15]
MGWCSASSAFVWRVGYTARSSMKFKPIRRLLVNDDLRSMLDQMGEAACRLLLTGRVTLDVARQYAEKDRVSSECVDEIMGEISMMPDDLRRQFLAGHLTIRAVRVQMLRRLVAAKRIDSHEAAVFARFLAPLCVIQTYVDG